MDHRRLAPLFREPLQKVILRRPRDAYDIIRSSDRLALIANGPLRSFDQLGINRVNKIVNGQDHRAFEIGQQKPIRKFIIRGMDKVDPVEDTRFPPFVAKSNAQSSRTEEPEARFFEIWM